MPRILPAAALLLTILALSCGGDGDDGNASTGATVAGAVSTATATAQTGDGDKPTAAPTPAPGEVSVANEAFSVEAPDGTEIKGHAYTPNGPKRQALIVVAPVEQAVWAESTQAFTSQGIAVFTFDLRGFGETGGDADANTDARDAQLITRFVISREYPLVYLIGVGETGGGIAVESVTLNNLEAVKGVVTYGWAGGNDAVNLLPLAPDAAWDGEDVLADGGVRDAVLEFVLGN